MLHLHWLTLIFWLVAGMGIGVWLSIKLVAFAIRHSSDARTKIARVALDNCAEELADVMLEDLETEPGEITEGNAYYLLHEIAKGDPEAMETAMREEVKSDSSPAS